MRFLIRLLPMLALLCLGLEVASAEAPTKAQLQAAARSAGSVNGLCPVMGRLVTATGGSATYKAEKIAFCCPGCAGKFNADPTRYMDRLRLNPPKYWYTSKLPTVAAMRAAKLSIRSANGRCPVMGRTVVARGGSSVYRRQKIQFCCPGCAGKFNADPTRYMRLMRADPLAYAYARPGPTNAEMRVVRTKLGTANGRCPVMGKVVVAKGGTVEHAGQKIGFCCKPCVEKFRRDPEKFMKRMRDEPASYGYVATGR